MRQAHFSSRSNVSSAPGMSCSVVQSDAESWRRSVDPRVPSPDHSRTHQVVPNCPAKLQFYTKTINLLGKARLRSPLSTFKDLRTFCPHLLHSASRRASSSTVAARLFP